MSRFVKLVALTSAVLVLNACAVGRMLTAGYTPPPLVEGLSPSDYSEELEQPKPGVNVRNGISLDNYKGEAPAPLLPNAAAHSVQPWHTPSSLFRPSFVHKSLADYAAQLSMELLKNSSGMKQDDLIGVASFVRLDRSLQQTNVLGNQLSEYFISEIQQFGLAVVDFKTMDAISVTERGDFVFSRNSFELAKDLQMDHMLSGTLIDKAKGVQINARIISIDSKRVVASASVLIPHFIADSLRPEFVSRVEHSTN
ncbi:MULTISPECIES: FlgO family outer membrane protein [Alteromonadaceae]|jgi:TolB-like protein|uniref:FlgO family outer membrane protein n=1 Tax=Brumicola blandensis TaxID=3075611 RepID=A0AAW8R147_9ALTE|nr:MULTISPECIES: FlgO family outer membrane protein [unclassified Alteromonas]MDT0581903.1 FlgO family outer membrane protein [Alteromonas sp. W409]MDT0628419.1 FlgO family outer membrane protein [Alteromonas sp. W364]